MIVDLKPYVEYKNSGLSWAGRIPDHWDIKRGKALFKEAQLSVRDRDEIVTCFRDGQVTLRRNRRTSGFMIALYEAGYQGVRRGQLVIHAMDAFAGAIGVSESDGKCTPEYIVAEPRADSAVPGYFSRLLRFAAHQGFILVSCPAVRERAPRFRYPNFGDMQMPVPPAEEQVAIVRFLDWANGRLERAIRAKKKELALVSEILLTVTQHALRLQGTRNLRLSTVAEVMSRPIDRRVGRSYTRVGLYNRGRGIFHKARTDGAELGDSAFFWVKDGDLVISGQFAWEGAVALARAKDSGCVASHRYPILHGREEYVSSAMLFALLRTPYGSMLLDHHSRGAAGRNRPLNASRLLKETVPIPPIAAQARVTELLNQEYAVTQSLAQTVQFVNEYRTRLVADVVTGKLDVREAAARLPDEVPPDVVQDETDFADEGEVADEEAAE
jgi:type I restriction enzyme S subunit